MEHEDDIDRIERKIRNVGTRTRWWGIVVFIVGVIMVTADQSSGLTIAALGLVVAIQGAIVQYVFR
jgi:uncharacterized membrane protein